MCDACGMLGRGVRILCRKSDWMSLPVYGLETNTDLRWVGWDDIDWIPFAQGSDQYWATASSYVVLGSIK